METNQTTNTDKKIDGALIGSIIVVLILVIGAIYVWQARIKTINEQRNIQTEELNSINQELDTIDTDFDIDVNNIN